ncbi:MAG TPA: PHP domain-containing protein [Planctomycetota bacterium]|nr:PHP domain-containing protein [Planctomycetota bacterium]
MPNLDDDDEDDWVSLTWEEENRPVDLHVHTTASDGDVSPSGCVDEAKRLGLAAIAITDHDTLAGNAEAEARGRETGIEVVPGVEISIQHDALAVHMLGYYPEPGTTALDDILGGLREHRDERNSRILARLAELGCPIDHEELAAEAGGDVVGRPHIAALMVRKGYVRGLNEAFDRYLARGAAAYVARDKPTADAAIRAILAARAVPVLAHPAAMGARGDGEVEALVAALKEMGLRGIEACYHTYGPGQIAVCLGLARRYDLLVTGGTDYHGLWKPEIQMGRGPGGMHVPYRLLALLKAERERL